MTRLSSKRPLAADRILAFLAPRAIPGVEEVAGGRYRRTAMAGSEPVVVSIGLGRNGAIDLDVDGALPGGIEARARHLFDLDADPEEIDGHLAGAPLLGPLIRATPGMRVPGSIDPFETGVRAILGQQVSVKGASTLAGRFATMLGTPVRGDHGALTTIFPSPGEVVDADLGGLGVPSRRVQALRGYAQAIVSGELHLDGSTSPHEERARLLEIPGVGPWTVEYISMRVLQDQDAFPASDLGLRKAADAIGIRGPLEKAADRWRPYRAYAAMHLWLSLAQA